VTGRDNGVVKSVPASLPGAGSAKWHNRRWWDPLGYLRVRTLANPAWARDARWLQDVVARHRPTEPGRLRDLLDRVDHELSRYRGLRRAGTESPESFGRRQDDQWDTVLARLDEYLEALQAQHLRAVEEAGRSGRGGTGPTDARGGDSLARDW
jgi:hypothetical protein